MYNLSCTCSVYTIWCNTLYYIVCIPYIITPARVHTMYHTLICVQTMCQYTISVMFCDSITCTRSFICIMYFGALVQYGVY